jgi:hypothetical protein
MAVTVAVAMATFHTLPAMVLFHTHSVAMTMAPMVIKAHIRCANVNADVGAAVARFGRGGYCPQAQAQCCSGSDSKKCFAEHNVHPFIAKVTRFLRRVTSQIATYKMNGK